MKINKAKLKEIEVLLKEYFYNNIITCDDYFESIILESEYYKITIKNQAVGFFTKTKESILSSYYLRPSHSMLYEKVLDTIIESYNLEGIIAITNDIMLVTEIMRRDLKITNQAFNFSYSKKIITYNESELRLRKANHSDLSRILLIFDDFLDNYNKKINAGNLYLGFLDNEMVSLGNINEHLIFENTVSIGVIVRSGYRNNGYGAQTIIGITSECLKRNMTINAGCWIKNFSSKAALLNSGYKTSGIIFHVDQL